MELGFGMKTDHSYEEVGLQFSITEQEVRDIAAAAFKKLRKAN
ncbi:MAG: sigma factor-like helix-turn-helix DNA-binding protein [Pelagibacteraceae bacterium]|jgi:DNA-directed RNA polymerase sigma subunit (sigma70/sigma32)|nr:sigma factor-like helix-turn-helix DNA-binding protein [Pelagibacteraceae bacterium]|tara:strand:- start:675 stop:803 length:129 start_codon:yes stop_codon:yes gene_type:complete